MQVENVLVTWEYIEYGDLQLVTSKRQLVTCDCFPIEWIQSKRQQWVYKSFFPQFHTCICIP